jgi:hypothetical protein
MVDLKDMLSERALYKRHTLDDSIYRETWNKQNPPMVGNNHKSGSLGVGRDWVGHCLG